VRSRRFALTILALAAAGAVTVGVVAVSGADDSGGKAAAAKGFSPKSLKGKWTGSWENSTFGSKGDILANVKFKTKSGKFTPLIDFSGNVLGCPDPPADSVTLKEGKGANKWNKKGFKVSSDTTAFANLVLTYKKKGNSITATGASPCDAGTTFSMTGTLTKTQFSANVAIKLSSGQNASATLSAQKG
jgi:hypothetical protein